MKEVRSSFFRFLLLLGGGTGIVFLVIGFSLFSSLKMGLVKAELSRAEGMAKAVTLFAPFNSDAELGDIAARLRLRLGVKDLSLSLIDKASPSSFKEVGDGRYRFQASSPVLSREGVFLLLSYERDLSPLFSPLFRRLVFLLITGFLLISGGGGLVLFFLLSPVIEMRKRLSLFCDELLHSPLPQGGSQYPFPEVEEIISSLSPRGGASASSIEIDDPVAKVEEEVRELTSHWERFSSSLEEWDNRLYRLSQVVEGIASLLDQLGVGLSKGEDFFSFFDGESKELIAHSEEVEASLSVMEGYIRDISELSRGLAKAVEETQASMARMLFSIQLIESNAKKSSELSARVEEDVELGKKAVSKTIESMERINRAVAQASEVIKKLGARSVEIGEILNVIEDVAEQTNLLAVNASIIAAQAGEQGKGFAVVADEIRDLASRTSSSAKDIAKLIASVQRESAEAVRSMEEGSITVEEGVKLSREAGNIFERILEGTKESTSMMQKIAEATVEQTDNGNRMMEAIKEVEGMIDRVIRAAEDYISRIPSVSQGVGSLNRLGEKLSSTSSSFAIEVRGLLKLLSQLKDQVSLARRETREEEKWREKLEEVLRRVKVRGEKLTKFLAEGSELGKRIKEEFLVNGAHSLGKLKDTLNTLKERYEEQQRVLSEYYRIYSELCSQLRDRRR